VNSPATSQDIYNFLATGEETNNSFFQFEAIVPTGGGPPPHIHSREDESFYVVSGSLEIGSTIRLIRPRPVFRLHSPRDRPPIQKCGSRHGHSVGDAPKYGLEFPAAPEGGKK
jgi:hypothetical protein